MGRYRTHRTRRNHRFLNAVDSDVVLQVEDNGVGVPPGDRDFILEGFHHTQPTDSYATKKPFDFNAGGKGLELMRLKIYSEDGWFDIAFDSRRCRFLPTNVIQCPGRISLCNDAGNLEDCRRAGGTTFSVRFHPRKELT
jgi:two-component system phosphate regulon sensor histidine kinase PhoR